MPKICGFMVVRKPAFAAADDIKPNLRIGEKEYRGIDRFPWEDLDDLHYAGTLQPSLASLRHELERSNAGDWSGLSVMKSYEDAKAVSLVVAEQNEIIALWSPMLAQVKGEFESPVPLELMGLDCLCFGEWSVLLAGVYASASHFEWAVDRINQYGLLDSEADCEAVFRSYVELSSRDIVEPLRDEPTLTCVQVYAVTPCMR